MKYACIIRGINVSGKNKVNMKELKTSLDKAGFDDVETYIQSGNFVFSFGRIKLEDVDSIITTILNKEFNVEAPIIILNQDYLKKVLEKNPFKSKEITHLAIAFLQDEPESKVFPELDYKNDEFAFGEKCVYLYCPDGFGRSKVTNNFIEAKTKVSATSRNMKTSLKLLEMMNH
jgi:uncharacterized protein (DUF1697 family)